MKRYHVKVCWSSYEAEDGLWVDYNEAHAIEQERDALKARLDERIHAYDANLWLIGKENCDLKAELAALKALPVVLSADEVKEEGWYRWSDHLHEFSEIVEIVEDADWDTGQEILVMLRVGHIGCCSLRGQFIGPIKMPEV